MVTTEQIKALEERQTALHTHLHIDDRRLELDEQESLTHAPDFWDDPGKAEEQLKKVAGIKYWITAYDAIASAMEELHLLPEFIREGYRPRGARRAIRPGTGDDRGARNAQHAGRRRGPARRDHGNQLRRGRAPKASTGLRC